MPSKKKASLTPNQRAFLAAYSQSCSLTGAARAAGVDQCRHYKWLKSDLYRSAFEDAKQQAIAILEDEAVRRAHEGMRRYKFTKDGTPILFPPGHAEEGKPYYEHAYSDPLLILLLKANCPDKYRENIRQELVGGNGGPVQLQIVEEIVDVPNPDENDPPPSGAA